MILNDLEWLFNRAITKCMCDALFLGVAELLVLLSVGGTQMGSKMLRPGFPPSQRSRQCHWLRQRGGWEVHRPRWQLARALPTTTKPGRHTYWTLLSDFHRYTPCRGLRGLEQPTQDQQYIPMPYNNSASLRIDPHDRITLLCNWSNNNIHTMNDAAVGNFGNGFCPFCLLLLVVTR